MFSSNCAPHAITFVGKPELPRLLALDQLDACNLPWVFYILATKANKQ